MRAAASRGVSTGCDMSRLRAVLATAYTVPASASSRVAHTRAAARMSVAREASASASACGNCLGSTRYSEQAPSSSWRVPAAPMLAGRLVWHRTMRTRSSAVRPGQMWLTHAIECALRTRSEGKVRDGNQPSHDQHRGEGGAPRRAHHQPGRGQPGRAHGAPQEPQRSGVGSRSRFRGGDHRHHPHGIPGARDSSRRKRRGRPVGLRLDHRPARRHHQLPARVSGVLRVDRHDAQGRAHPWRDLRPDPQRPVHRLARARRVPQRQAAASLAPRQAHRRR